ncbi:hypothetical protein HYY74_01300 [Candidatus Woesearchaeota archaeon]|nr:hypothetical protein [Candidatus Woesearchaeota archaeon]
MYGRVLIAVDDEQERNELGAYVTELYRDCIGAVTIDSGDASILNGASGQRQAEAGRAYDFIIVGDTPSGVAGIVGLRQAGSETPVYMIGDLYPSIGKSVTNPEAMQDVLDHFAAKFGATQYADMADFTIDLMHIVNELAWERMRPGN